MPSKRRQFGIQPPQLPPKPAAVTFDDERLHDQAAFTQCSLANCDLSDQSADDVLFEQALLKRVTLARTQLISAQMIDVRCEVCDFAGAEWEKTHLTRIEWTGCRLMGMKLMEAQISDAVFKECHAEFLLFWSSAFNGARFERCNLSNASFQDADLSGVVFKECDLSSADLRGAKLAGADLRGSKLDGLNVGIKELQGAIIEPAQAVQVVGLLGIMVKWDE
jgi:uncharacterized protein YjbI with pentapeptide repeats